MPVNARDIQYPRCLAVNAEPGVLATVTSRCLVQCMQSSRFTAPPPLSSSPAVEHQRRAKTSAMVDVPVRSFKSVAL
jgi:hypothetical protein